MKNKSYQFHIGTSKKNLNFDQKRISDHNHRNAKYFAKNINPSHTKWNYYSNKINSPDDVIKIFDNYYQNDLKKYNAVQSRKDRQKKSFYKKYKKKELLREVCLTVNFENIDLNEKKNRDSVVQSYKQIVQKYVEINNDVNNTNMVVHDFVVHFDEAQPHCHFVFSRSKKKKKLINGEVVEYNEPVGTSIEKEKMELVNEEFGKYMESCGFEKNKKSTREYLSIGEYREFAIKRDEEIEKIKDEAKKNANNLLENLDMALNRSKLRYMNEKKMTSIIYQVCENNGLKCEIRPFTNKLIVEGVEYYPDNDYKLPVIDVFEEVLNKQMENIKYDSNFKLNISIDEFNKWSQNKLNEFKVEKNNVVQNANKEIQQAKEKINSLKSEQKKLNDKISSRENKLRLSNLDLFNQMVDIKISKLIPQYKRLEVENQELKKENKRLEVENQELKHTVEFLNNKFTKLKNIYSDAINFIKTKIIPVISKSVAFNKLITTNGKLDNNLNTCIDNYTNNFKSNINYDYDNNIDILDYSKLKEDVDHNLEILVNDKINQQIEKENHEKIYQI